MKLDPVALGNLENNWILLKETTMVQSRKKFIRKPDIIFKEGDVVQLRHKAFTTHDPQPPLFLGKRITKGKIVAFFPDVKGLVLVEPRLGGYHTWDVEDLEKI